MSKTILLAGKDSEDCGKFTDGLLLSSRQAAVTGKINAVDWDSKKTQSERKADTEAFDEEKTKQAESGLCSFEWIKSSALSARNIVLETENYFSSIDETLLYFDEEFFASRSGKVDAEEIARTCDEMILGFQYLTYEILSRYERKFNGSPRTLVFILKECPSVVDVFRSPGLRDGKTAVASPVISAAAGAFTSFAENIAAAYGDESYINIILVRGDSSMEETKREETFSKWLCSYMDEIESGQKLSAKKSVQWVKPGSRKSSGFNFFRR